MPTIGWSQFALERHKQGAGHSYITPDLPGTLIPYVLENWDKRKPGHGETTLDRKVVVPINPTTIPFRFICSQLKIANNMYHLKKIYGRENVLHSEAMTRQDGEDPFIGTHVSMVDVNWYGLVLEEAKFVNVVCYSADALLENGGTRSTDCEWEVVCLICSPIENEPMCPLTMARNQLEKAGGTKGEYTAQQYAESIYYWSQRIKVKN